MALTPRENLLKTSRCENPQWIPVCPNLVPGQKPTGEIPDAVKEVLDASSDNIAENTLTLGAYLNATEFLLPAKSPAKLVSDTCPTETQEPETNKRITIIYTPKGDLRKLTEFPGSQPPLVTERYLKTLNDVEKMIAYFASLRIQWDSEQAETIRRLRETAGNKGVLFLRCPGTPLGMCYRVFSDITNLIYMITDAPETMKELFTCMEDKYLELYKTLLKNVPEVDVYFAMDDTSTTLISPDMFETFNTEVTDRRAEACHRHGKIYMHHACGLIHDLLPIYRKTKMDGVQGFTTPPMGDVTLSQGRRLLGPKYSILSSLGVGLDALTPEAIQTHVESRFKEAATARNIGFQVGGAFLTFQAMERIFKEVRSLRDSEP